MSPLPPLSEAQFQRQVIDLAHLCGWLVAHFRAGRTAKGWRTPVSADGAGWPDLVLVHARRQQVLFRELKTDKGELNLAQVLWLAALSGAGLDAGVWRPRDWERIVETLTEEARTDGTAA